MSNATFNAIVMRYSNRDGHVKFDDFVACVIKLKTLFGKIVKLTITKKSHCYLQDFLDEWGMGMNG